MSKRLFFVVFCLESFLFINRGNAQTSSPPVPSPWLTGPLIAPIGAVVPYGDFEIESYIYYTANTGSYNENWHSVSASHDFLSLNPQFLCFFGLTPWMDINIVPQFFYNRTSNQSSWEFGDLQVALDFQMLSPTATPYFPGIKFVLRETFPTGSFERLNPNKLLTDLSGEGTFATTFNLVLYQVYHLKGVHFLSTTYSALYTVTTPVQVHGLNAYGGGFGTKGKVLPGNSFQGIISFELTLSQNWAFAIDHVYTHTDSTRFSGFSGVDKVGAPSSEQISFAPAIEYNFSSHFGIAAGCWFTAWGRNSAQFCSGVVNFDYSY